MEQELSQMILQNMHTGYALWLALPKDWKLMEMNPAFSDLLQLPLLKKKETLSELSFSFKMDLLMVLEDMRKRKNAIGYAEQTISFGFGFLTARWIPQQENLLFLEFVDGRLAFDQQDSGKMIQSQGLLFFQLDDQYQFTNIYTHDDQLLYGDAVDFMGKPFWEVIPRRKADLFMKAFEEVRQKRLPIYVRYTFRCFAAAGL